MEINDLIIREIEWRNGVLTFVRETDPLLRRFGQVDVLKLNAGEKIVNQRQKADEIWAVAAGKATFTLEDTRPDSPSLGEEDRIELNGDDPRVMLIPFGVKFRISPESAATLVRLTTHQDDTDLEDTILQSS